MRRFAVYVFEALAEGLTPWRPAEASRRVRNLTDTQLDVTRHLAAELADLCEGEQRRRQARAERVG